MATFALLMSAAADGIALRRLQVRPLRKDSGAKVSELPRLSRGSVFCAGAKTAGWELSSDALCPVLSATKGTLGILVQKCWPT